MMYDLIKEFGAKPADECSEQALASAAYHRGLIECDRELERVTDPVWGREYLEPVATTRRGGRKCIAARPSSASPSKTLLFARD
jgi:hypothetical protein